MLEKALLLGAYRGIKPSVSCGNVTTTDVRDSVRTDNDLS